MHIVASCCTGLLCAAAFIVPSPAAAQLASPLDGFDARVEQVLRDWNVPGVQISVVKDGKPLLVKGYGVRDPATGQPMTAETIVPIASMTKAVTSFTAGLLVDDGKIGFDTPAIEYLPGLKLSTPDLTSGLTVRDMLTHRSGLPRHDALWYHNSTLTRDNLLDRLPYLAATQPLRAKFQYNNLMFSLAGITVERMSGEKWESFVADRVLQPLHMTRSMFGLQNALADPNHGGGRQVVNGKPVNVSLFNMPPLVNPAGGMYSTANDLTNWMIMQLDGGRFDGKQIIQPATLAEMHRTQIPVPSGQRDPEIIPIGYGMGWFTDIYRGNMRISDLGEIDGSSTIITLIPSKHLGAIVLANHGTSELPELLSRELLDRLLGGPSKDWTGEGLKRKLAQEASAQKAADQPKDRHAFKPARPIAAYAGDYDSPAYGKLTVRQSGGRLVAHYGDDSTSLAPRSIDVFAAEPDDPNSLWRGQRVQFVSDLDGRIVGAKIRLEPTLPPAQFDLQPDPKLSDPSYLTGLVGTYLLDGDMVHVTLSGNSLTWLIGNGLPSKLIPSLDGEFLHERARDWHIRFKTDAKGQATSVVVDTGDGKYEGKRLPR